MTEKNITKFILLLAAGFYVASLTQEAYCTGGDCKSAFTVLLFGPLGIMVELGAIGDFILSKLNGHTSALKNELGATLTWLANPIFLFALFVFRYSKGMALTLGVFSTTLILIFMTFDTVIDNEAGLYNTITSLKLGYWLWLCSSVTIVAGSLIVLNLSARASAEPIS